MSERRPAPPLLPADPRTWHRWHWIKGNDVECWEYMGGRMWTRPGSLKWKSAEEAAAEGWSYIGEAHPPGALK